MAVKFKSFKLEIQIFVAFLGIKQFFLIPRIWPWSKSNSSADEHAAVCTQSEQHDAAERHVAATAANAANGQQSAATAAECGRWQRAAESPDELYAAGTGRWRSWTARHAGPAAAVAQCPAAAATATAVPQPVRSAPAEYAM